MQTRTGEICSWLDFPATLPAALIIQLRGAGLPARSLPCMFTLPFSPGIASSSRSSAVTHLHTICFFPFPSHDKKSLKWDGSNLHEPCCVTCGRSCICAEILTQICCLTLPFFKGFINLPNSRNCIEKWCNMPEKQSGYLFCLWN